MSDPNANNPSSIDFILRGSLVKRFHTRDTIKEDLVGRHEHGVAMLCYFLTDGDAGRDLLMAGMTHDQGELRTGDLPSPTKRALGTGMGSIYEMEKCALLEHKMVFVLTDDEHVILNIADNLDGMLFCIRERRLGNEEISDIFHRYDSYVAKILEDNPMLLRSKVLTVVNEVRKLWRWE
jgi:5'-deoxynucleotidase YfbR-like HD superfamily hydrolase